MAPSGSAARGSWGTITPYTEPHRVRSVSSQSTLGIVIGELQCGMTYAVVQVCSSWVVVGVKVVWLYIPHIARGVNEAVRWVCGDRHGTPIVADKEAKGTPLSGVTPGLESITCHLEVNLYVLNKV